MPDISILFPMYIFNPEHDLCLANGDANFVPPASAMKFGQDCPGVVRMICCGSCGLDADGTGLQDESTACGGPYSGEVPCAGEGIHGGNGTMTRMPCPDRVVAWGWNRYLKKKLILAGVPEDCLPSDGMLHDIRELSHRRTAVKARAYLAEHISDEYKSRIVSSVPEEITDMDGLSDFLDRYGDAVLKAPWSGSGKGLRWVSRESVRQGDSGWCANVMARQGSVIAERREDVAVDFAMLFRIGNGRAVSDGFSLFFTENGAYRSNLLASDGQILDMLSAFIPRRLILEVREAVGHFLELEFAGRYEGHLGVDMFICRSGDMFMLSPCVEINVRMTMGLLARRLHDSLLPFLQQDGDCHGQPFPYLLSVVHAPDSASLKGKLSSAVRVLTDVREDSRYALAVFRGPASQ